MKKIIKQVKDNIVQVTIADERWYGRDEEIETETGERVTQTTWVPSVTWIAGHYPKGIAFYKWLADKGWNEAEALKSAAGDKGSKVHSAVEDLIAGKEVKMDSTYLNKSTEQQEELSLEEYECIMSFVDWWKKTTPEVLANEVIVFNDEHGYAGTVDMVCKIGEEIWLIDFKTGQYVWPEYELQISAYRHAFPFENYIKQEEPKEGEEKKPLEVKLGVLQIGYRRNKNMWKLTEIEDKFDLFLAAHKIWANETAGQEVSKKDYPLTLTLKADEAEKEIKNNGKKQRVIR